MVVQPHLGFRIQWETQEEDRQVAGLHLHRRPAHPVAECQDPCPDEQDVAAGPQVGADPAQPEHARFTGPATSSTRYASTPWATWPTSPGRGWSGGSGRCTAGGRRTSAGLRHPAGAVETDHGGRDRAVRPANRAGRPVPLSGQHNPQPLGPQPRLTAGTADRARVFSPVPASCDPNVSSANDISGSQTESQRPQA